jgi:hypothetical protein
MLRKMLTPAYNNIMMKQQKGFAPIWILILVIAGIAAGTLLVQNGVNFLPKAAEQEPLHPSAGQTQDCSKLGQDVNQEACLKKNNETCAADTVTYCDNRQGSPRAIRKSGGYYEPGNANADRDSGCVFDYREVEGKKSECGKQESKSGDVVYTTVDEAKKLDNDRKNTLPERQKQAASSATATSSVACTTNETTNKNIETSFKDENVANNIVRFYAILNGAEKMCVPADLGVSSAQTADSRDGTVKGGRLMLCSGEKEGGNLPLYWMVPNVANTQPILAVKDPLPEMKTIEAGFKTQLEAAKKQVGL